MRRFVLSLALVAAALFVGAAISASPPEQVDEVAPATLVETAADQVAAASTFFSLANVSAATGGERVGMEPIANLPDSALVVDVGETSYPRRHVARGQPPNVG